MRISGSFSSPSWISSGPRRSLRIPILMAILCRSTSRVRVTVSFLQTKFLQTTAMLPLYAKILPDLKKETRLLLQIREDPRVQWEHRRCLQELRLEERHRHPHPARRSAQDGHQNRDPQRAPWPA